MIPEPKEKIWLLPESAAMNAIVDDIGQDFTIEIEPQPAVTITWFDTFDWRLYRRRKVLLRQNKDSWYLLRRPSGEEIVSLQGNGLVGCSFSSDFPPGRLRTVLEPILGVRRLLPLVTLDSSGVLIRFLNQDEKVVAFLFFHEQRMRKADVVFRTVKLRGIRGYDKDFKAVSKSIRRHGIVDSVSPFYALEEGVRLTGRCPLDYSSEFSITLKPEMSARQATLAIFRRLLEAMQRNTPGIIDDLDSEFLHDFRVALRRTRSGLALIKRVLPPEITETFKKEFAELGRVTGAARDLDVYLLYEKDYKSRLPASLRGGVEAFFADIRSRREIAQKELVRSLRSPEYREMISRWHDYLDSDDGGEASENSELPIKDLAGKIILRSYRRILNDGKAIKPSSSDKKMHRLRIHCKKLRYSLEFFASLFPPADIRTVINQLKKLQNNLGAFNDLSVQQEMLHQYLARLRPGSGRNQQLASAIGGLLTSLHHEQQQVREAFFSKFRRFARSENTGLYKKLFG
ncbi:MAG TPA: CHAD domain-containing protein [Desulfobacteraceae bacterium]|nr:CHAD domain protein [bacterium BMS3Abin13]HDL98127.1 CHAD domain-containing protein [Desulfobacteraceae bacterium]HDO30373.1 CHAD domain-containing protein [Desulfobacteraceae bacterium]